MGVIEPSGETDYRHSFLSFVCSCALVACGVGSQAGAGACRLGKTRE